MTDQASPQVEQGDWRHAVHRIAQDMGRGDLSPGDVASLRRLRLDDPAEPAFWRLVGTRLRPWGLLDGGRHNEEAHERRWATILNAAAWLKGLHQPRARLGRALAAAGLSELRFVRFLRAGPDAQADHVRAVAMYLAAKAEPVDLGDLAGIVLTTSPDKSERMRRRVARDYYDQLNRKDKETSR